MKTTVEALKSLYVAMGGDASEVADISRTPDVISAIAGYIGIKDTGVQPAKSTNEYWGVKVSAMQTGITVADGAITGTLKFIQGGITPTGTLSGDGNFLALKFIDNSNADSIKVGLVPSASGMDLVELDADMDGVFKVSGKIGGVAQVLKVVTTKNGVDKTQVFDLSGLTLNAE